MWAMSIILHTAHVPVRAMPVLCNTCTNMGVNYALVITRVCVLGVMRVPVVCAYTHVGRYVSYDVCMRLHTYISRGNSN